MVIAPVRRISANVLWLGAGEGAVKAGLFLSSVFIARSLGAAALGTFTVAFAVAMVGLMVLAAGQQEVVIREVAAFRESARGVLAAARGVQNRLGLVAVPAIVAGAAVLARGDVRLTILALVPYVVLRAVMVTHGAAFKGLDRMDVEVRARVVELGVVLAALALGAARGWPVWFTGGAFSLGASCGLLWILSRSARLPGSEAPRLTGFAKDGLPFLGVAILTQLLLRGDSVLMAWLGVSKESIGHYGAAGMPVWGVLALSQLCAVSVYPTLARVATRSQAVVRALVVAVLVGLGVGGVAAGLLVGFRQLIIQLAYGQGFEPTIALFGRLAWVVPAAAAMTLAGTVLASWRKQHLAFVAMCCTVLVSITLNLQWIPAAGATGAANAAIVSHFTGMLVLLGLGTAGARRLH